MLHSVADPVVNQRRGKDYKEILNAEDFAVFAQLRELRKEIAHAEGVPVYAVFSNISFPGSAWERAAGQAPACADYPEAEPLKQCVPRQSLGTSGSQADLEKISGIGAARIDKYGNRFLEMLGSRWSENHEQGGKSV